MCAFFQRFPDKHTKSTYIYLYFSPSIIASSICFCIIVFPSIFRCTQTRGSWIFPATLHDMIGFVCFIFVPSSPPFRPFSLNSIDFMDPTGQPFYNPCEVTISRAIHTVLPTYVNPNINKSFSQTYISYSRIFDSHLRKASYLLNKWKPTATPQRRLRSPPIQSQPQRVAHLPKRRPPSSRTAS